MAIYEEDKVALSDEDMEQAAGGFQLNYLVGGSGSGTTGMTMERRVVQGSPAITGRTLQGVPTAGLKLCPDCSTPLDGGICPKCGWPLLKRSSNTVVI